MNCLKKSVLRYRVGETDQIIIGRVECDVGWDIVEVGVEMLPKLGNGELSWMLWVEVW